jgi:hypothetical protein
MRLLVLGHRYSDADHVYAELDAIKSKNADMTVIQAGGLGAEKIARKWCLDHHVNFVSVKPGHHSDAATPEEIISMNNPDEVLVFGDNEFLSEIISRANAAKISARQLVSDHEQETKDAQADACQSAD